MQNLMHSYPHEFEFRQEHVSFFGWEPKQNFVMDVVAITVRSRRRDRSFTREPRVLESAQCFAHIASLHSASCLFRKVGRHLIGESEGLLADTSTLHMGRSKNCPILHSFCCVGANGFARSERLQGVKCLAAIQKTI